MEAECAVTDHADLAVVYWFGVKVTEEV